MKTFATTALLALLAASAAFEAPPSPPPPEARSAVAETVAQIFSGKLDAFRARAEQLREAVETLPGTAAGAEILRERIARLREQYKELEFLAEYLDPEAAVRLNGAPFDRADLDYPGTPQVIAPEGLQVLYGIAAEPEALAQRAQLADLAAKLEIAAWELSIPTLDDRQAFEAMEAQVIRVMTKGITGFDAPPELSFPETRRSLLALREALGPYLPELTRRSPSVADALKSALDKALRALAKLDEGDFDDFDRLTFIRGFGNPLYAAFIEAHETLGIFHSADLYVLGLPARVPVNPLARNLFAPDFINVYGYSRVPGERPDSAVAALGRRLFFDPVLSGDGSRSCASCHDPRKAFADGLPKSPAFGGHGTLPRNTPSVAHAAWQRDQFWDLREKNLDEQALHVILGEAEFRSNLPALLQGVAAAPGYVDAFRGAFPRSEPPVSVANLTRALAQYLRSLPTARSPFDRYARGETDALDPAAKRGFNLFMGKALCATCHFPPGFNGTVPAAYRETEGEVLGVPERFPADTLRLDPDPGRYAIHNAENFRHAFKTPTVRNAALTAPYMHNGSMATLEDVLDFYNAGGGRGLGLDVPNQTLPADSLGLSRRDMDDIIKFIESLTDTAGFGAQGRAGGY